MRGQVRVAHGLSEFPRVFWARNTAPPAASWQTAFGLGFISSVFDNILLTALALKQGGYDWAVLPFTVGFGGSMVWFGSSAGVAISNRYPAAKSVGAWLKHGWFVAVAYAVGFLVMLALRGWHPGEKRASPHAAGTETAHIAIARQPFRSA